MNKYTIDDLTTNQNNLNTNISSLKKELNEHKQNNLQQDKFDNLEKLIIDINNLQNESIKNAN
jgi:NAD+--asparagine ADP-ribosyltransferase